MTKNVKWSLRKEHSTLVRSVPTGVSTAQQTYEKWDALLMNAAWGARGKKPVSIDIGNYGEILLYITNSRQKTTSLVIVLIINCFPQER